MKRNLLLGLFAMALGIQAQTPTVSAVTNGASYSPVISPGALVAIFGDNFGDTQAETSVKVGGLNAPVYFSSRNQINVQLPSDLRAGASTLTVTVRGAVSAPVHLNISPRAPALLTADASGTGRGAFIRSEDPAPVTAATPGETIFAYATGLGGSDDVSPVITVGGLPATVSFAGPAPGLTAVFQVAFVVPAVTPGNQDVVLSVGSVKSPVVTLPVGPKPVVRVMRLNPRPSGARPITLPTVAPRASQTGGSGSGGVTYTCNANISTAICNYLNSTIAGLYSSAFNNVSASIYIQLGNTGLGQSLTATNDISYTNFQDALSHHETDANDVTAVNSSVPTSNPNGSDQVSLTNANMRALGFSATFGFTTAQKGCTVPASGCYDGLITVSSQENTDGNLYYRTGPAITSNQYDFYTVVEHETDEILGTASCLLECSAAVASADLFRYHSSDNNSRSFATGDNSSCFSTSSTNACFSIDGVTMLQQYNNINNGQDFGDWATNCGTPFVQDAIGCPGIANLDISPGAEILVLDVVGFTLTSSTGVPDLTISKSHTGSFTQGQSSATYTITASNSGTASTSGMVTVSDALPQGLTATSMNGTGWSCTQPGGPCTRSDALSNGQSYAAITLTVKVASNAAASVTNTATISGGGEANTNNDTASDPTTIIAATVPDMTITMSHTGSFTRGQTGATYTITAMNSGTASTSGLVTVTVTLPTGLTGSSISGGSSWTCTQPAGPCTRSDALTAGSSYPVITLTVNVASNAPATVINMTNVSGGGETNTGNDTATDPTTIGAAPPALTITKTHTGSFTQGQAGGVYTVTVTNGGLGPTSGTVTVTDTVPSGLTLVSMSGGTGNGWSCSGSTCTRADALAAGASYPVLTATVNVAANATSPQVNSVRVSGGGSANATATDSTVILANPSVLTIAKTHTGSFTQGQLNALYTLVVSNQAGAGPTSGQVKVAETIPSGLTLVSMTGTGWTCSSANCTRSDALNGGSAYPSITVTVNVALTASTPQINQASVSGGGTAQTNNVSDTTVILPGVAGTISATTSSGSTFTYVLGTTPASLPLSIASSPSGVTFSIAASTALGSSVASGVTPNSPSISVNTAIVTAPGTQSGNITVSAPNSALNCASPVMLGGQSVCTATAPFTINVQPSFFQGETSAGSGFYNLSFFGTYDFASYSPVTIYHTSLGFEIVLSGTDSNRGIYLYDSASGHIWYTNPSEFPFVYDFSLSAWLYYFNGNATKGGRSFYNFGTSAFIFL